MKLERILSWLDKTLMVSSFDDVSNNGLQVDRRMVGPVIPNRPHVTVAVQALSVKKMIDIASVAGCCTYGVTTNFGAAKAEKAQSTAGPIIVNRLICQSRPSP